MTFKHDWEKSDQKITLSREAILQMTSMAFPQNKLQSYEIISGGCANLNVKINLESENFILRIYLRDQEAPFREESLSHLIGSNIPIPKVYFIGRFEKYRFAVVEYFPGITLSQLLLSKKTVDIFQIMKKVGVLLAKIQDYTFPISGFFSKDLIVTKLMSNDYHDFAQACLKSPMVLKELEKNNIEKINVYIEAHKKYLPDENEAHLVHGDFDPSNILVDEKEGSWSINAILDWEFAFSGSPLTDVANMLRYARQLPPAYEKGFLAGLEEKGVILPNDWKNAINILNVISLLDCLARSDPTKEPIRCKDICELLKFIIKDNIL